MVQFLVFPDSRPILNGLLPVIPVFIGTILGPVLYLTSGTNQFGPVFKTMEKLKVKLILKY